MKLIFPFLNLRNKYKGRKMGKSRICKPLKMDKFIKCLNVPGNNHYNGLLYTRLKEPSVELHKTHLSLLCL